MSTLTDIVRYELLMRNWGEAEKLDWSLEGVPSYAIKHPDGTVRFWPKPTPGITVREDDKGYFVKIENGKWT